MAAGVGPIGQELVSIIRQRIGDLRLSDKEVSRRAKMSNSTLATRLTGNTNINVDELAAICGALGLDPGKIVQQAMVAAGLRAKPNVEPVSIFFQNLIAGAGPTPADTARLIGGIEDILASSDLDESAKQAIRNELIDTRPGDDTTES